MTEKSDPKRLIDELVDDWSDLTDEQRHHIVTSLAERGIAALEPLLEALEHVENESTRHALLEAASSLGVYDERVRSHLVDLLEPHPLLAAMLLSGYGDPNTLPDLRRTLDRLEAGASAPLAEDAMRELEWSIEELAFVGEDIDDGANVEEIRREIEEIERETARLRENLERRSEPYRTGASEKLGRNDPCWCGSGRKYKQCHRASDRS